MTKTDQNKKVKVNSLPPKLLHILLLIQPQTGVCFIGILNDRHLSQYFLHIQQQTFTYKTLENGHIN